MQDVGDPQHVRGLGLEPAEHGAPPRGHQVLAREVPLQSPLRRRIPGLGDHDPPHLRRGALHVLPLQRRRHRQHALRGDRLALSVAGQQRLEPAGAPGPDPPVDGLAETCTPRPPGPACTWPARPRPPCPAAWSITPSSSAGHRPVPDNAASCPGPPQQPLMLCQDTLGTSLGDDRELPGAPGGAASGYVTGELVLTAPGGPDGTSSAHRDSRAASCPGDNPATSGHRPGVC